jgi:hypothetical protein
LYHKWQQLDIQYDVGLMTWYHVFNMKEMYTICMTSMLHSWTLTSFSCP